MASDVATARLSASWSAVGYLAANGAGSTVRQLAKAAGVSERTFYRYFPTREDILRPAMRDSQDAIARAVDAQPLSEPLGEALMVGWSATAAGVHLARTRSLLPVVFGSPTYGAVWSQELRQHGDSLKAAVARRLGCHEQDERVEVALTVFLPLCELALAEMVRTGGDPVALLRRRMVLASCALFEQRLVAESARDPGSVSSSSGREIRADHQRKEAEQ